MKKRRTWLWQLLVLAILLPLLGMEAAADTVASGQCGEGVYWSLDDAGTMTISGSGAMNDYTNSNGDNPRPWTDVVAQITAVEMDDTVTRIGSLAFGNCENLKTVDLSASLQSIGDLAFGYCIGLETITFPESLTVIEANAFMSCTALKELTIPASVSSIGQQAFYVCSAIETVRFLGDAPTAGGTEVTGPFRGSTATAYYPAGNATWTEEVMQSYGGTLSWEAYGEHVHAFDEDDQCTCGITGGVLSTGLIWTLDSEGTLTISGSGAMNDYINPVFAPWYVYKDQIKAVVVTDGVTNVGQCAFKNYDGLASVTLGADVGSINKYAFQNCTGLTGTLALPDSLRTISESAFNNCSGITELNLNQTTTIERYAFEQCSGLKQIVIPDQVTSLGESVFGWCTGAESVSIGSGITEIPANAFRSCTGLTGTLTIPDTVTSLGTSAFDYCTGITALDLGDGLKTIGNYAFDYCVGLEEMSGLPGGLEYLGEGAFKECQNMEAELIVPASLHSIGSDAFWNCKSIKKLTIGENSGLVNLGSTAFGGCEMMKGTVVLPESITTIPDYLFYRCSKLNSITIKGNITAIGHQAFEDCNILTFDMKLDGLTSIGLNAFFGCWNLEMDLVIPASVRKIEDGTFYECVKLTSLKFEENSQLESIGSSAFLGCTGLTGNLVLPETVEKIGDSAFNTCPGLTGTLVIPDSVWFLGGSAFSGTDFEKITLGKGVEEMGKYDIYNPFSPFYYCHSAVEMDFTGKETIPTIYGDFKNMDALTVIHVPWEAYAGYKSLLEPLINDNVSLVPSCYGEHAYTCQFDWKADYSSCTAELSCPNCGESQSVSCTVTSDTIPATEEADGSTTYTAVAVFNGKTYTDTQVVTLPKIVHSYGKWHSDKDSHWNQCTICGKKVEAAAHIPGPEATENTSQKCTVCGCILRTPLGLDWLFDRVQEKGFVPSGYFAEILGRYAQ